MVLEDLPAGVARAARHQPVGGLELDDLGPEVGEVAARQRRDPVPGQLDDADAGQRPGDRRRFRLQRLAVGGAQRRRRGLAFGPLLRLVVEPGRRQPEAGRRLAQLVRVAGQLDAAGRPRRPDEPAACAQLLLFEERRGLVDRRAGDAQLLRPLEDLGGGVLDAPAAGDVEKLLLVIGPRLAVGETGIVPKVGALEKDEVVGVPQVGHEDGPAVLALDGPGAGPAQDGALVRPSRRRPAVRRPQRFEPRHVDVLPFAGLPRPPQRAERGDGPLHPGVQLPLMAGHHQRLALRLAAEVHVAAQRPLDDLLGLPIAPGAGQPERRDRDDDEGGVVPPQVIRREAQRGGAPGWEVLDDEVGLRRQGEDPFGLGLRVERNALLVGAQVNEPAAAVEIRRPALERPRAAQRMALGAFG